MSGKFALLVLVVLVFAAAVAANKPSGRDYKLVPISAVMIALYAFTFVLSQSGKISPARHRAIWNFMLLAYALVSCGLGLLLVLRMSYGLVLDLPFNALQIHVMSGIAMSVVAAFHIGWHLNYFKQALKI